MTCELTQIKSVIPEGKEGVWSAWRPRAGGTPTRRVGLQQRLRQYYCPRPGGTQIDPQLEGERITQTATPALLLRAPKRFTGECSFTLPGDELDSAHSTHVAELKDRRLNRTNLSENDGAVDPPWRDHPFPVLDDQVHKPADRDTRGAAGTLDKAESKGRNVASPSGNIRATPLSRKGASMLGDADVLLSPPTQGETQSRL